MRHETTWDVLHDLPSTNRLLNMHWGARGTKKKRLEAKLHALSFLNLVRVVPTGEIHVVFTRIGREVDDDNIRGCWKSVRDGIADAFGINDRSKRWKWNYEQRPKHKDELRNGIVSISFNA